MLGRQPSAKRHTKPCKYFQTSQCPLSSQECDFAHVLLDEIVAPRQSTVCRYYATGNCGNGPKCRYKHVDDHPEERKAHRLTSKRDVDPPYNQNPSSFTNVVGPNAPPIPILPFHPPYHMVHPGPPSGSWAPYSDPYPPPVYCPETGPIAQFFKPGVISPSYSAGSSGSASSSARSSLSEDVSFVTEDPKYNEHSHQYQSQIRVADARPVIHVPPFYPSKNGHGPVLSVSPVDGPHPAHPNMLASHVLKSPVSPVHSPTSRSRSNSRYKASNYKTKLCKFFGMEGVCPNGNDCTFIHEPVPTMVSSTTQSLKPPPGLPPKPVSQQEENRKRNYFPVAWRVIGGGVLVGDPSHSSASNEDGSPEWSEDEGDYTEKRSNDHSNTYSGPVRANSSGSPSAGRHSGLEPVRRPRSTSIPSTSRQAQLNMKSLFSAESPGSL